jgi:uncharacterized protein YjbI with pentapeptide repeats
MEHDEALKLLTGGADGVAEWNQRRESGEEIPDLIGAYLRGAELFRADLRGADLSEANLSEADLDGANLYGANLREANFRGAKLRWANLNDGNLRGADLREANLVAAGLIDADLRQANLIGAGLTSADLTDANLIGANLFKANLSGATLLGADLNGADLIGANLSGADLRWAHLSGADLSRADLLGADLNRADLTWADLRRANLDSTRLSMSKLIKADLHQAKCEYTIFADVDLSETLGLDSVVHKSPSTVGIDTLFRSRGKIPVGFLRGCGVPEVLIEYQRSLFVAMPAIQFYSCFISYSSKDQEFASRLHSDLQAKGVRCWFDRDDLKIGEKIRHRITEAIRGHDKLMLVLSERSIASDWVEGEVEAAFERERREKQTVLFPIRLDDAVLETPVGWASLLRQTRHIGDFSSWKDDHGYQGALARLLRDLKAEASTGSGAQEATAPETPR